ncbi:MAG: glycerophosphodiester phosphodiesterase [Bacteroidetes bacterium]|nr:MAG: glycerophosphodiester phosphodiesterase [Bacteroidota bacterium]
MKYPLLISLLVVLSGCVPQQPHFPEAAFRIEAEARPWVIGHGGAKDLAPENTLLAFDTAYAIGVDMLEMDVCMTADEVLVTHHDETIDRMSDGSGRVIELTYADLLAFNFGEDFRDLNGDQPYAGGYVPIPTLEQVLSRYPDVSFNVELKNQGENGRRAAERLWALIQRLGLEDRILVASFHDEVLAHFRDISGYKVPTSSAESETEDLVFSGLSAHEYLVRPRAVALQLPTESAGIPLGTTRVVRSAHRRNMAIHYWTINDPDEMRRLIQLGADGLITDRPDLMWEVLHDMGW